MITRKEAKQKLCMNLLCSESSGISWVSDDFVIELIDQLFDQQDKLNKRMEELETHQTCEWKYYSDEFGGTYITGCGDLFSITEGTPSENNMKYCHCCGAIIIEPKEQQ